jgi:hypothetical protein
MQGRVVLAVPFAGLPVLYLRSPLVLGVLAALLAFLVTGEPRTRRRAAAAATETAPAPAAAPAPMPPVAAVRYSRRRRAGALALFAAAGVVALRLLVALARPARRRAVYS